MKHFELAKRIIQGWPKWKQRIGIGIHPKIKQKGIKK